MCSCTRVQCHTPSTISSIVGTLPGAASSCPPRRCRGMVRRMLPLLLAALFAPAAAQADGPPLFDVGTAVVDVTPATPQYLGGYDHMETPTAKAHDPLEVRAFFVGHGNDAVAFAIVDSQGWFAGYQEGP